MPKGWPKEYYSLIYTTQRKDSSYVQYDELAKNFLQLIQKQPGFLGIEIVREENGLGVNISYWKNYQSIINWYKIEDEQIYQPFKREKFYIWYQRRVSRIISESEFGLEKL